MSFERGLVTEYRAQILIDEQGRRYVAAFPAFVARPIQYGCQNKSRLRIYVTLVLS